MPRWVRWVLAAAVVALVVAPPVALFRAQYAHAKRFREVTPGRFYRAGQMTEPGFREMVGRYGIRTVINLQHEDPNPSLKSGWLGNGGIGEKELCEQLGVRYHLLTPDVLPKPNDLTKSPPVVAEYLQILDDPTAYPVLIHCKAGLHRTGRLAAIYRMEYEGWTAGEALREMRANGYGYGVASEADDFVTQFVGSYARRPPAARAAVDAARAAAGGRP